MNYYSIEYRKFLVEHYVFDAWQYVENARKNIVTAGYCYNVIENLIKKMEEEHKEWQEEIHNNYSHQLKEKGNATIGISIGNLPSFKIDMLGVSVDYLFLIDKYIKDFFHYIRNAFDSISQIVNSSLLANESISIEIADFGKIVKTLNKPAYSQIFSRTLEFLKKMQESDEFKYSTEFNNRIKHICDAKIIMSRELFGENVTNKIKAFYKKGVPFSEQDILTITHQIYEYVGREFITFLNVLTEDIKLDTFIEGRIHQLSFYSQDIKDDPNSSFTAVFIEVENSLSESPETIRLLLVNDNEDIMPINCDYEEILVRDKQENFLGKYVLSDLIIDEGLLRYRKYTKVQCDGLLAFFDQIHKNNPIKPYFMSGKIVRVGYNNSEESKNQTISNAR